MDMVGSMRILFFLVTDYSLRRKDSEVFSYIRHYDQFFLLLHLEDVWRYGELCTLIQE
jgi:hypothetical protein